jgi:hypothetical protein
MPYVAPIGSFFAALPRLLSRLQDRPHPVGKVHSNEADKKGDPLFFRELPEGQGEQAHCNQQLYNHGSEEPPRCHQGPGILPRALNAPGHPKIRRQGYEAADKCLPFAAQLEAPNPQSGKAKRCKLRPYDSAHDDGFLHPRVISDARTCGLSGPRQRRSFF